MVAEVTQQLKDRFQLSEVGKLHYLLGIQVSQQQEGVITLSQGSYIDKILRRFGMEDCNPQQLPISPQHGLRKWKEGGRDKPADQLLYQQIIGCLIYLVTGTRPDLAFVTMLLSQYASKPNTKHMGAAKRVLRYLKGTRDITLKYHRNGTPVDTGNGDTGNQLIGFADSDLVNDKDDGKSISGYIYQLNRNTISWRSKKRSRKVPTSTTEAELFAMAYAVKHMLWLQEALRELQPNQQVDSTLYRDNQGTLNLLQNYKGGDLTKHVVINYHFLRNVVQERGCFHLQHVPSTENLVDICTKGLAKP